MTLELRAAAALAGIFLGSTDTSVAQADVLLQWSKPADGARLARSPADIEMGFSGSLRLAGHEIEVVGPAGNVEASGRPAAADDYTNLHMPLMTPLGVGAYTVRWSVLSERGTVSSGRFMFTVLPPGN